MDIVDQLDEMEERLEQVHDHLDNGEYEAARDAADGIGDILDCALCKNIENGVLGGVMFVAAFTPEGREDRADAVQAEIRRFLDHELPVAKDHLRRLDGEEVPAEL